MTASNEATDEIRCANRSEAEGSGLEDDELGETSAAYQKVEAFDLFGRPVTAINSNTNDELAAGAVLGGFTILRPLASGGMGHVFLARQGSLSRLVALKVCKREMARDSRMKSRFMAEGVALARLRTSECRPSLEHGRRPGLPLSGNGICCRANARPSAKCNPRVKPRFTGQPPWLPKFSQIPRSAAKASRGQRITRSLITHTKPGLSRCSSKLLKGSPPYTRPAFCIET